MNNRHKTKFISHKQNNVCLMPIKSSHKVNKVKRDLLPLLAFKKTCMQHLPSVPFVLRLFFLHVHQTNIPATASAATDPNAALTIIHTVLTKRDKLEIIFCKWKRVFFSQIIWLNFNFVVVSHFSQRNPFFIEIVIKGSGGHLVTSGNTNLTRNS